MHTEGIPSAEAVLSLVGKEAVDAVIVQVAQDQVLSESEKMYSLVISGADLGLRAQMMGVHQAEVGMAAVLKEVVSTLDEQALQASDPKINEIAGLMKAPIAKFLASRRDALTRVYTSRMSLTMGIPEELTQEYLSNSDQDSDILFRTGIKLFEASSQSVAGWYIRQRDRKPNTATNCDCPVCLAKEVPEGKTDSTLMDMIAEHGSLEGALVEFANYRLSDVAKRIEEAVSGIASTSSVSHVASSEIAGDLWRRISKD